MKDWLIKIGMLAIIVLLADLSAGSVRSLCAAISIQSGRSYL